MDNKLDVKPFVSHNIKMIRKRMSLTQDGFSNLLQIKRATLGSYEEQRCVPPASVLIQISELSGIDLNTLVSDKIGEEYGNE